MESNIKEDNAGTISDQDNNLEEEYDTPGVFE